MPTPVTDIDQEIQYILDNWIQNNNQLVTGTIGQNVVWNLAQFIKTVPENYQKATVVTGSSNYTTNNNQCIVIFTNNTSGGLNWVDNRWYKYYFVNATDNIRAFTNGKFYYDINGNQITELAARTSLYLAKGNDDFWYEISANSSSTPGTVKKPLIGVAGRGGSDDPLVGDTIYQNNKLIGVGSIVDGVTQLQIQINDVTMSSYGLNASFTFNNTTGLFDLGSFEFEENASLYIDLNQ